MNRTKSAQNQCQHGPSRHLSIAFLNIYVSRKAYMVHPIKCSNLRNKQTLNALCIQRKYDSQLEKPLISKPYQRILADTRILNWKYNDFWIYSHMKSCGCACVCFWSVDDNKLNRIRLLITKWRKTKTKTKNTHIRTQRTHTNFWKVWSRKTNTILHYSELLVA